MAKCSKAEVRRLRTVLRWKIPAAQRQRIQMVLLRESGMSQPAIAAAMGVSLSTVNRAHMAYVVVSAGLTAFGNYLDSIFPSGKVILTVLNVIVSLMLISFLFAAIYKVLPDRRLEWGDVVVGAIATGVLFTVGKSLISWYIGSSAVASSFGAAGGLIVLLLWVGLIRLLSPDISDARRHFGFVPEPTHRRRGLLVHAARPCRDPRRHKKRATLV